MGVCLSAVVSIKDGVQCGQPLGCRQTNHRGNLWKLLVPSSTSADALPEAPNLPAQLTGTDSPAALGEMEASRTQCGGCWEANVPQSEGWAGLGPPPTSPQRTLVTGTAMKRHGVCFPTLLTHLWELSGGILESNFKIYMIFLFGIFSAWAQVIALSGTGVLKERYIFNSRFD